MEDKTEPKLNTTQLVVKAKLCIACGNQPVNHQMQLETESISSPVVVTHTHKAAKKNGCPDLISDAACLVHLVIYATTRKQDLGSLYQRHGGTFPYSD